MTKTTILRMASIATILLIASAGLAGRAHAQGAAPAGLPNSPAEFEKQLALTDAQKAKIKAINAKYLPKFKAIQEKYRPMFLPLQKQHEELQAKELALQKKYSAEVTPVHVAQQKENDALLTPLQRQKVAAFQAAVRAQMQAQQAAQQGGQGGQGGAAPR